MRMKSHEGENERVCMGRGGGGGDVKRRNWDGMALHHTFNDTDFIAI